MVPQPSSDKRERRPPQPLTHTDRLHDVHLKVLRSEARKESKKRRKKHTHKSCLQNYLTYLSESSPSKRGGELPLTAQIWSPWGERRRAAAGVSGRTKRLQSLGEGEVVVCVWGGGGWWWWLMGLSDCTFSGQLKTPRFAQNAPDNLHYFIASVSIKRSTPPPM